MSDLDSDDATPVIDEGLTLRASQIDWSLEAQHPPAIVVCRGGHTEYRSLAKFDLAADRIIAKTGCPVCGTHEMSIIRRVARADTVVGEIAPRCAECGATDKPLKSYADWREGGHALLCDDCAT